MHKVHAEFGYDFYIGSVEEKKGHPRYVYNIVRKGSNAPEGGYYDMRWIEKVKGVQFPDRYQPTRHGMRHLYMHELPD